jgi:hypothetical protein
MRLSVRGSLSTILWIVTTLAATPASAIEWVESWVLVDAPGCSLDPGGMLQVKNNIAGLHIRVQVSATFNNGTAGPTYCGSGGGGDCGERCRCSASDTFDLGPGVTLDTACAFPFCYNCSTDCGEGQGQCPGGPGLFCTQTSNASFKITAYSCNGSSWTELATEDQVTLTPELLSPCGS